MTFPNELIPVLGPVLATLIAASAAFLASVLSKESKISEFRQARIDHLRNDLADFIGVYTLPADMVQSVDDGESFDEWVKSVKSEMLQVESAKARIVLRLDPDEHNTLISRSPRSPLMTSSMVTRAIETGCSTSWSQRAKRS